MAAEELYRFSCGVSLGRGSTIWARINKGQGLEYKIIKLQRYRRRGRSLRTFVDGISARCGH